MRVLPRSLLLRPAHANPEHGGLHHGNFPGASRPCPMVRLRQRVPAACPASRFITRSSWPRHFVWPCQPIRTRPCSCSSRLHWFRSSRLRISRRCPRHCRAYLRRLGDLHHRRPDVPRRYLRHPVGFPHCRVSTVGPSARPRQQSPRGTGTSALIGSGFERLPSGLLGRQHRNQRKHSQAHDVVGWDEVVGCA